MHALHERPLSLFMEGGGSFDVQDYSVGAAAAFGPDGHFAAFCKGLEKLRLGFQVPAGHG